MHQLNIISKRRLGVLSLSIIMAFTIIFIITLEADVSDLTVGTRGSVPACTTIPSVANMNDNDGGFEGQCDKGDNLFFNVTDITGCQDSDAVTDVNFTMRVRVENGFSTNGFQVYISDNEGEDAGTVYCVATFTPGETSTIVFFDCEDNPSAGGLDTVGEINDAVFHMDNEDIQSADWYEIDFVNVSVSHACSVGGDTCTYTSGNWDIDCTDACIITSDVAIDTGSNISFKGDGFVTIRADISNWDTVYLGNSCTVMLDGSNGGGLV